MFVPSQHFPFQQTYANQIKSMFGSSLLAYYPLDETSGTVAYDRSGNGRNGAYVASPTLANLLAPGGKLAPLFNGTTQYVEFSNSGLPAVWNGQEGSISFWYKALNAAVWDGASNRNLFLSSLTNNSLIIQHQGVTAKSLRALYTAAGTADGGNHNPHYPTAWNHCSVSWSKANDHFIWWNNGSIIGEYNTLGTWAGVPTAIYLGLWSGWLSDLVITNRETTDSEKYLLTSSAPSQRIKRISFIGDSITANSTTNWVKLVKSEYLSGAVATFNRAIAGSSIAGSMATQAALCANDRANVIIVAHGANDNDAGNMTTLRATYEAGLDTLQVSNPNAIIYLVNIWPLWEADKTTPKEKGNIRTMISAVGAARGLTVWNPYSESWYSGAETSDGVHPNSSGDALITAQIKTRLS